MSEQTTSEIANAGNLAQAATEGKRARRVIVMKQFIPDADWINVNIVAKGKGTQVLVGRVFGVCTGYEDKENTLPNGEKSKQIVLRGSFEAESYVSGEVTDGTGIYLPMAYAEKVKALYAMMPDLKTVEIDCDIGLEATGKTIPYEWVVIAYREGEASDVMKRLKSSRARPAGAPALPAPAGGQATQIAAPATGETPALAAPAGSEGETIEGEVVQDKPDKPAKSPK